MRTAVCFVISHSGGEGLLSCEELARCLRRPDPAPEPREAAGVRVSGFAQAKQLIQFDVPQRLRQSKRYDLAQKQGLVDFLKDADIRLVHTPSCSVEVCKGLQPSDDLACCA